MVNWDETKERLRKKITKLTDNDLLFIKEREEEVLRRLQEKLGQTREAVIKIISKL